MSSADARTVPRQGRSRQLVARIVDATARLVARQGTGGLSTNAVAAAADVSVGSLYRYFPNKDALIVAVVEREGRRFQDRIRAGIDREAPRSVAGVIGSVVGAAVGAYGAIGVDDMLAAVELHRADVFDRRAAARAAVAAELADGLADADRIGDAIPIVAEIVVALIEAATTRPTAILHAGNMGVVAADVAIAYVASPRSR